MSSSPSSDAALVSPVFDQLDDIKNGLPRYRSNDCEEEPGAESMPAVEDS
jgi:hypothetical protein